jgi:Protein of unknown function (DUF3435)
VSLIFSPHVFLFALLFHANAFEASNLKSMEKLRRLWVTHSHQEMELPLKREMGDCYLFCKVKVANGQVQILRDQPLTKSTLYGQLKFCSMIHGFLNPLFSHQFRYGGGKLLDASDKKISLGDR